MSKDIKKSVEFNLVEVIVIILITGIVVSVASGLLVFKNYDKLNPKEEYDYIDTRSHWDNSIIHKNWLHKLLNSDEENIKFDKNN